MNYDLKPELVTSDLGWPEGPTVMPDGSVVFVESYRSQLTLVGKDGKARQFAYVTGAPNSCVLGSDGALYVCQNGGTVGPWRAAEMTLPSIQRVRPGGKPEILVSEVDGIKMNGPNDLVFGPDGTLVWTDPGTYNPANPDPSYIYALSPDGRASVKVAFPAPTFPNGVVVEADGSIVWDESYTGHVCRLKTDGTIEDLGRMPGKNPILDGMAIAKDGSLLVTDLVGEGFHVLARDGTPKGFVRTGGCPTNLAFDGETLWVTDASVLASSAEPNYAGRLWRLTFPGGGAPTYKGSIGMEVKA
ncbi:SMP-30/gluconolactonase/LRE family protein [Mesorhizobium sp. B2-8-3]|uniref:SMP-30/gluconolactonase/LRE family protein n=1 Tax=Mesorhizobium sp. B2-8-3 TaxID=2589905 RepID=UPI00112EF6F8|nr:SMP-30/gluconolactonase/LRE family protein [Mesorhizobium sp. B2-8-3]TPJ31297.1 SMP-30/gluconolactonase/LRE family protein [Mesorhizobium sp. B2-8-3]